MNAPSANQLSLARFTASRARACDGSINSIPCTGVNDSDEARPDVAVPDVLIDAMRPLLDLDSFAGGRQQVSS